MEELLFPKARRIIAGIRSHCWAWAAAVIVLLTANARSEEVVVHNYLSACATLEQKGMNTEFNLLIADANLIVKQPISECGCFSASATYTSYLEYGGVKDILQQGHINALRSGAKKLVLSSDAAGVRGRALNLDLACTPPL